MATISAAGSRAGLSGPARRPAPEPGGTPVPAVSRRREVGGTSARSLLMTVLGEYVLPGDTAVWTISLVRALALVGVEEKSARQALARSAAEGWLHSERNGRRVRWELTGHGRQLLSDGASRIYSFGQQHASWDGRWLMLLVSVPEAKRDLRHQLRTRLTWAGFGTPAPGIWLSPQPARETEARRILAELGLAEASMSFLASYGSVGRPATVVRLAWDLDSLTARYEAFIAAFGGLSPTASAEVFAAQTRLVHEWRRFPFLDPQLPGELLPQGWAGASAAELFHARHASWRDGAGQQWEALLSTS
ncbi:MAG TPA: PaaX family transcriptional regulator C-terminal domain-containing protein [Streptosporangiaceae bacterium]